MRTLVGIKNIWFQLVRVEEKILFSGGLQEQSRPSLECPLLGHSTQERDLFRPLFPDKKARGVGVTRSRRVSLIETPGSLIGRPRRARRRARCGRRFLSGPARSVQQLLTLTPGVPSATMSHAHSSVSARAGFVRPVLPDPGTMSGAGAS